MDDVPGCFPGCDIQRVANPFGFGLNELDHIAVFIPLNVFPDDFEGGVC